MSAAARANLERLQATLPIPQNTSSLEDGVGTRKRHHRQTLTPDMAEGLVKAVDVSDDGNTVRIILSLDPSMVSTAQQKGAFVGKDGKVHFFTKAKIAKAAKTLRIALSPHAQLSRRWGNVPIEVVFDYFFAYPSSTPKKDRHRIGPMNERPDVSNITKGICDAMTEAGFWVDDSYINNEFNRKRRTNGPACTRITIVNLRPKFEALFRATEENESPTLFQKETVSRPEEQNPLSELELSKITTV